MKRPSGGWKLFSPSARSPYPYAGYTETRLPPQPHDEQLTMGFKRDKN